MIAKDLVAQMDKYSTYITGVVTVLIVSGFLLFYWLLSEYLGEMKVRGSVLAQELTAVKTMPPVSEMKEKLEDSNRFKEHLEASIWKGETTGSLNAKLQEFLRKQLSSPSSESVQINVGTEILVVKGIEVIGFDVSLRVSDPSRVPSILANITGSDSMILVENLLVEHYVANRNPSTLKIRGFAPVVVETSNQENER